MVKNKYNQEMRKLKSKKKTKTNKQKKDKASSPISPLINRNKNKPLKKRKISSNYRPPSATGAQLTQPPPHTITAIPTSNQSNKNHPNLISTKDRRLSISNKKQETNPKHRKNDSDDDNKHNNGRDNDNKHNNDNNISYFFSLKYIIFILFTFYH